MIKTGNAVKTLLILGMTLVLAACGSTPQPTVTLTSNIFAQDNLKVGYTFVAPKEKATTHIYGAGCLLCYGVASALTSSLDKHLKTAIDNSELQNISALVKEEYAQRAQNLKEVKLPAPIDKMGKYKGEPGFAKKDFRSLKESLDIDVLVVLELSQHGAYRSFSNYVPNGDPQGHIAGVLYAVDLSNNAYVQYLELNEKVQPEGEWDEPPTFPGVTTSYYQAVENIKARVRDAI